MREPGMTIYVVVPGSFSAPKTGGKMRSSTVSIRADYPNPDLIVNKKDECELYYQDGEEWKKIGITHNMVWKMNQFVGCRFGLLLIFICYHFYTGNITSK
jgi:hypothetical protein